jgi:acetyl-CoA carboxylase biotin carboxyl carrier protein
MEAERETINRPRGRSTVVDEGANPPGPFDVATIKALVTLMSRHDLSEIYLREGDQRVRLRRGVTKLSVVPPGPLPAAAAPSAPPAAPAPKADGAAPARPLLEIKSPTPGTFYAAPSPAAEPYVRVGARVEPTTVVCQIEAMKIFNEIQAECSGVIAEILVDNRQSVEYGQVLFRVDPTG